MDPKAQPPEHIDLKNDGVLPRASGLKEQLRDKSEYRLALNLIEKYYPELSIDNYQSCQRNILKHLATLKNAYLNLEDLRGKTFLDIACGSRQFTESYKKAFDPWMPRLLLELGANVVGVDLAPQIDERFTSYQVDLTNLDALAFLADNSFDACHIDGFPTIEAIESFHAKGITWENLKINMKLHIQRLLKSDGITLLGFTESNDKFVATYTKRGLKEVPDEEL